MNISTDVNANDYDKKLLKAAQSITKDYLTEDEIAVLSVSKIKRNIYTRSVLTPEKRKALEDNGHEVHDGLSKEVFYQHCHNRINAKWVLNGIYGA